MKVVFVNQAFDDRGTCRGGSQTLRLHCHAQLVVLEELACPLHCREQRRLGVARRRLGLTRVRAHFAHADFLVLRDRRQVLVVLAAGTAVHREPARVQQYFAFGFKVMLAHARDARGLQVLRGRVEHGKESPYDHVVELVLGFVQLLGRLQGGDDGEVIRDPAVVEYALVRPHPALLQDVPRKGGKRPFGAERLERSLHRADVILGQRPRIGSGIGENFVSLVQRLGERQSHPGGKAKTGIGLALQARQIEQQRGELGRRLGLLARDAALAAALGDDRLGLGGGPKPLWPALSVVILLEPRIEPAPGVLAAAGAKPGVHFPVASRGEGADFLLALHQDGERRGLHAADGSEVKAPLLGIEGGHRPRAVDAHQPIGLGAALGGIGEWQEFLVCAQAVEAVADRLRRHRLQPQALDRLFDARVLDDVAEDELALASCVAGIDEPAHIPSFHQPQQQVEPLLAFLKRC